MLGVYLTAAELTKRGFVVSPTSRSAIGADLLATDVTCNRAWSVQVKTNRVKSGFWLCGPHARTIASPSHIYVFVNAMAGKDALPEFYVVGSQTVSKRIRVNKSTTGSVWYEFHRDEAFRDAWSIAFD